MRSRRLTFISVFYFVIIASAIQAQYSDQTQISLLTCDPGKALYSTFGHSAIRVFDPISRHDQVYNYGTFNAFEDNFYIKFLRGKLNYKLSRYSYGQFLNEYNRERRNVIEQVLQLDAQTRDQMLMVLENNNLPQNQYYLYDFFFDNCSSRIRDIAENELPGFRYQDSIKENKSFRDLLDEHLGRLPWSDFGIDLIIGARADRKATFREQMFLPVYLSSHLSKAKWNENGADRKLLSESYTVLDFSEDELKSSTFQFTPLLLFCIILILELILSFWYFKKRKIHWAKIYEILIYSLVGLAGFFMLFMWFGTDHQACGNNWNILWANPFFLILAIILLVNKQGPALRVFLMICLAFALICWNIIPQSYHISFVPIILWLLLILGRTYLLEKFNIGTRHKELPVEL